MKRLLMTLLLLLTVTLTQAQLTAQLTTTYDQSDQVSEFDDLSLSMTTTTFESETNSNLNLNMNMMKPYGAVKDRNSGGNLAIGLLVSGAAFLAGGLLAKVPYEGYNGPNKPFFQQGPRMYAIMGGSVLMGAGLIISIP
jgi:hypothetical protein